MTRALNSCEEQLLPADAGVVAGAGAALDVDVEEEPKPAPVIETSAAPAAESGRSCTEIGHSVYAGDPDYSSDLDRDGDGLACE